MEEEHVLTRSRSCGDLNSHVDEAPKTPGASGRGGESIGVFLRQRKKCAAVELSEEQVNVADGDKQFSFPFDGVMGPNTTQEMVFLRVAAPLADSILEGKNAAVIAYGSTSTGKTFTMFGNDTDPLNLGPVLEGLCPRLVREIFRRVGEVATAGEEVFTIAGSMLEIYNERLYDLLLTADEEKRLTALSNKRKQGGVLNSEEKKLLREAELKVLSLKGSILVKGAKAVPCRSPEDLLALIGDGFQRRRTAPTLLNHESSRSHAVFLLTLTRENPKTHAKLVSQVYLCDLAGAESINASGVEGERLVEASKINQSLFALSQVIEALSEGNTLRVPYRNSLLTRILKNCLGGNSKSRLILTVADDVRDIVSTCRFGQKSKKIQNRVQANKIPSINELQFQLEQRNSEIELLKEEIARLRGGGGGGGGVGRAGVTRSHIIRVPDDAFLGTLICPLSRRPFKQPVVFSDGFCYEKSEIEALLQRSLSVSPLTGQPLSSVSMMPNYALKDLVWRFEEPLEDFMARKDRSLEYLSRDCLVMICWNCDGDSLLNLEMTSKKMRAILNLPMVWNFVVKRDLGVDVPPNENAKALWMKKVGRSNSTKSAPAASPLVLVENN